ncbi:choice-of-anchor D domain-containing protein [Psychroserpens mesophilus]|uniref:choice-of-anchor D domain-containing protein n=1 Tax=Psychroserpens mesophilus TaxID=325473 RepID=UPI003D6566CD
MEIFTLSLRKYALLVGILFITNVTLAQTADFNVQHLQDDIGNSGGTTTSFSPVGSLNNAVALANNNRKSNAGPNSSSSSFNGDDLSGARVLTATNTLSYYRESGSNASDMRFNTSIWEYVGAPGGDNEMIIRGRYAVNLNGSTNSVTRVLTGISNADKCIPFITGIRTDAASSGADSGTAIAYLEDASTLRVEKGTNSNDVIVYVTVVEYTGSNWTVLHGDSGNTSGDNGTITLRNGSDGTGTATNVSSWNEAIIFTHHRGDNNDNRLNEAIADNWPLAEPGSNNQRVDWTFDANHDSNGTNRQFVHVLVNPDLNVTRYQNTDNSAGETTIDISSSGLSSINEALIVGNSITNGGGTAYARGWRNYYLKSTTQAAHWSHRSGNTMEHEIQIVDLSGLTSSSTGCISTISTFPYSEGFESGLGAWTQSLDDDRDWTRDAGGTPSNNTGPSSANEGIWYMFTEASFGDDNKDFYLDSPCFDLTAETSATFSFYYHMYGTAMGDLFVDVSTDGGLTYSTTLWSQISEDQTSSAQAWELVDINLAAYLGQTINLRFRGETGYDYRSDMAIDNITLTAVGTPTPEINITGLGQNITDGDVIPDLSDDTDFGTVNTPSGTNINTFTIENTGTAALSIGTISIGGTNASDFTVSSPPAASVTPSGSTTFDITFDPSANGLRTANVTIVNGDSNENPYNFNIQGTGFTATPEINITGNGITISDGDIFPTPADDTEFPAVSIAGSTHTNTFTIENTGTAALSIGAISFAGANASDFTVSSPPAASVAPSGSTTFDITFDPSAAGPRLANITIVNNDSDENTYYFNIQGFGITPGICTSTVTSYPYSESFDSGIGLWTQDINGVDDDIDWTRLSGGTSSNGTGPSRAQDGNFYMYTEATGNPNSTAQLVSPCFDLTSASNPRFTFFFHMRGSVTSGGWTPTTTNYMGDLHIEVSTDNGLTYSSILFTQSGYVQEDSDSAFIPISINLNSYIGQIVKLRIRGETSGDYRSDMAIDMVTLVDKPTPTVAPGGVTSSLALWLKADDGLSYTSGQNVSSWQDQGLGSDARVNRASQAPTYYDNVTKNVNFNPVIEFDNSYASPSVDSDYSHDSTSSEFLSGDYGFYTQEVFIVVIPDDTPINRSFGFMDVFCSDAHLDVNSTDATGLGFGNYTGRVSNEVICYAHDSYDNDPSDGYGVAQTGSASYNNVGIINTRNNTANTRQELYYNANDIENTQNDIAEYMNSNDSRWWIGRSEGWEASLNARVAEVITYSSRKADANLTQERNRIQSYLGIKYGITLGVNGTTQDYVNSDGTVIWDQSANVGYNYDIAGIGRDDASELNQKQSRSVNNASDGSGRTEGILTIGLTDIYDTNKLNQSNNATILNDKEYLVWGNNGADLELASSTVSVNMSAGITPALTTNVTFTAMQRVWKVVENGGDIPKVKVRIPQNAIRNITPPGSYYMFISSTGVFDPTADYRVMKDDGFGNLETEYDFDNTKYITFGYAPQVIVERSIYFDGAVDYIDMEDALDLNPSEFTISAWIKRDAADSGTKSIVSKRNTAFTRGYDFRILDDNRVEIYWKNASDQVLTSSTAIPDEEWHHVAVTYSGSTTKIFIDGIEDSSDSRSAPVNTDESFYIAAAGKGTPVQHFRGNIDEVRVWNRMLTPSQLRFIMNQEIENNSSIVAGKVLPTTISKNDVDTIPWNDLAGYYPMSVYTYTNTEDASGKGNQGALRNLNTVDRQTAPLPYESTQNGNWDSQNTWRNGNVQTIPGTTSLVKNYLTVDWNIIRTNHNVTIDDDSDLPSGKNGNRTVLGLMVDSNELEISGMTDATTNTGYGLTVSHYLNLTGTIDLEGESQLIQTDRSDLVVANSGRLERDQQGTADTFTYNYWSSPVGQTDMETNEFRYNLTNVIQNVGFKGGYNGTASPLQIADYWVWTFSNLANGDYSAWQQTRSTGTILAGEGFTMKGPGSGLLTDDQNYIFRGKPNNGDIALSINAGNNYLVGNPYASAIDAVEFINDNLGVTTGTLYFWEHWGGGNHVLADYQGGYALMNLSGGTPSVTLGQPVAGVSNTGTARKTPGRYIPVSQGFFVVADAGGPIVFENDQRQFQKEDGSLSSSSVFIRNSEAAANADESQSSGDPRMKFRIGIYTVNTIQRQLLLTIDPNATTAVDLGYDGVLNEEQMDDMFWMIDGDKYIIQGSNDAEIDTTYPLGVKTDSQGLNIISINGLENVPDSMNIFIHDIENNIYHNLRESDYEIYLDAGEYLDRFEMTFRDADDTLSTVDNELSTLEIYYSNDIESLVLLNPDYKKVKSIELFNIVGQSIHTIKDISELDYSEYEVKHLSSGTYIVKINTASGSVSKKVLVK